VIGSKWSQTAPASEIEKSLPAVLAEKKTPVLRPGEQFLSEFLQKE
jgi:hypothetical protein